MGFVCTAEEIARIQKTLIDLASWAPKCSGVDFLTTPEFVESVSPPGLEPGSEARVPVMAGRWRSNCVADFHGGAIYVAARHDDLSDDYVLAMYMDRDEPIIFGRELFGEPKKQASSRLHRRDSNMSGWVERDGVRLIEPEVDLQPDQGSQHAEGINFNYNASSACDGVGLEDDALPSVASFSNELDVVRSGTGTLTLASTHSDPSRRYRDRRRSGGYLHRRRPDRELSCRRPYPRRPISPIRTRSHGWLESAQHRGPVRTLA